MVSFNRDMNIWIDFFTLMAGLSMDFYTWQDEIRN